MGSLPSKDAKTTVVIDTTYDALVKASKDKFKLTKKDLTVICLFVYNTLGEAVVLSEGSLAERLTNNCTVVVTNGAAPAARNVTIVQRAVQEMQWVSAGRGFIAARGCPSIPTLEALREHRDLTGVVTLLRSGERECASDRIQQACERHGLSFCHAPLEGVNALLRPALSSVDLASFATTGEICDLLSAGDACHRLVVHCSAGLHRTSLYMYVLLRRLGDSPEGAVDKLQHTRQKTHDEFVKRHFLPHAERILEQLVPGAADQQLLCAAGAGLEDCMVDEGYDISEDDCVSV